MIFALPPRLISTPTHGPMNLTWCCRTMHCMTIAAPLLLRYSRIARALDIRFLACGVAREPAICTNTTEEQSCHGESRLRNRSEDRNVLLPLRGRGFLHYLHFQSYLRFFWWNRTRESSRHEGEIVARRNAHPRRWESFTR